MWAIRIWHIPAEAGANRFARALALEVAPHGIRVDSITHDRHAADRCHPCRRAMQQDQQQMRDARARQCPLGRMGRAWDIAEAALFLASDRAGYIAGTELVVMAVFQQFPPGLGWLVATLRRTRARLP
ncbi:MAG: SDR family oxidoreductase [Trueperaceae bacterium]|nr:SDR family oxidoreductase [Trueperaceae bacterium]